MIHYVKRSIYQENITILKSIYTPNIRAPKYIKRALTDRKAETATQLTVGDFNTLLSTMDRSYRVSVRNLK